MSALDTQVGGSHYKDFKIQPIEFTHQNNLNFCQGNVIKYITRYKFKNGIEDLKKIKHYVDLLIELEYGESSPVVINDELELIRRIKESYPWIPDSIFRGDYDE
jgi:hypothetical protein